MGLFGWLFGSTTKSGAPSSDPRKLAQLQAREFVLYNKSRLDDWDRSQPMPADLVGEVRSSYQLFVAGTGRTPAQGSLSSNDDVFIATFAKAIGADQQVIRDVALESGSAAPITPR